MFSLGELYFKKLKPQTTDVIISDVKVHKLSILQN